MLKILEILECFKLLKIDKEVTDNMIANYKTENKELMNIVYKLVDENTELKNKLLLIEKYVSIENDDNSNDIKTKIKEILKEDGNK